MSQAVTLQESSNITIDPAGELTIKVIELNHNISRVDGEYPVLKIAFMKVQRKVLMDASSAFKAMLNPSGPFKEASQDTVTIQDDTVASIELWFRCLHKTLTPESHKLDIKEIWHAIEVSRKYFLDLSALEHWFVTWFKQRKASGLGTEDLRALIFPCLEFNVAAEFAFVTKSLAYDGIGHVTELNPTHHGHLHLFQRVIQQINAVKGTMRGKLHRGLFEPIKVFLAASCSCKEAALYTYCKSLDRTWIWPLELHAGSQSINSLLDPLESFSYTPPQNACGICSRNFKERDVDPVLLTVETYFGGLCLDCMGHSKKGSLRDKDHEYWMHDRLKTWSRGCRIAHEQPTWYFSFMGRKEDMDFYKKRKSDR